MGLKHGSKERGKEENEWGRERYIPEQLRASVYWPFPQCKHLIGKFLI